MQLPQDPMMLLSVINMKLRDCYNSLDELCYDLGTERTALERKLREAGFEYDRQQNRFR